MKSVFAATCAGGGCRCRANLLPLLGRVGVQRQGMDLPHQLTQGGIDLLVALDAVQACELLADQHRLVMGL
ncbi:hypothetical protein D3C72_2519290 [compost metagenome]